MALARLIRTAAWVAAAVIVAAILLYVFSANPATAVVRYVHDAGAWLAGPFKGLFWAGSRKGSLALNWGIAALVYLAVGHLLAGLLARAPRRGARRVRPVV
jgi:hypothetical protein